MSVPDDSLKQLDVCSRRLPQARTGSSTLLPPNNGNRVGGIVETGYPVQPPAQFLGSVLVDNSDLVFTTVVVRHVFSP